MALSPEVIAAIGDVLTAHAGLALPAWVIEARASARIAAIGCSAAEYVALIDSARGAGELAALVEAVRVGESRLFRHHSQIDALTDVVVPALRAQGRRAIRVWSAGCAAGEEPYTLAIVLSRALPDCALSIVATDVSGEALARARTASYPRSALAHVPAHYRDYFVDEGDAIRVAPAIAALVGFERANLLDGAAPRGCDLVWCRNVLIYFSAAARRRAIERLVGATRPGGFLFVGYSESLRDIAELETVRAGDAVYYVRRAATFEVPARPEMAVSALRRAAAIAPVSPIGARAAGAAGERAAAGLSSDRRAAASMLASPMPGLGARAADDSSEKQAPAVGASESTNDAPRVPRVDAAIARAPTGRHTLVLLGHPTAAQITAAISAQLARSGLRTLVIDLDRVELLDDDVAPVLRRACSAAAAAGIAVELYAQRPGPQRWLARHDLDDAATGGSPRARRDPEAP